MALGGTAYGNLQITAKYRGSAASQGTQQLAKDIRNVGTSSRSTGTALADTTAKTNQFASATTALSGSLKSLFGAYLGVQGARAVLRFSTAVYESTKQLEAASAVVQAQMVPAGHTLTSVLNQMREATLGTVSDVKLLQQSGRAMQTFTASGIEAGKAIETIASAARFAAVAGQAFGINIGESLERIITGLSRGSPRLLDDFGIMIDLQSQMFQGLDEGAQKLAVINEAIRQMNGFVEEHADSVSRATSEVDRLATAWENFKSRIGTGDAILPLQYLVNPSGVVGGAAGSLAWLLNAASGASGGATVDDLFAAAGISAPDTSAAGQTNRLLTQLGYGAQTPANAQWKAVIAALSGLTTPPPTVAPGRPSTSIFATDEPEIVNTIADDIKRVLTEAHKQAADELLREASLGIVDQSGVTATAPRSLLTGKPGDLKYPISGGFASGLMQGLTPYSSAGGFGSMAGGMLGGALYSTVVGGPLSMLIGGLMSPLQGLLSDLPGVGDLFKSAADRQMEAAQKQYEAALRVANTYSYQAASARFMGGTSEEIARNVFLGSLVDFFPSNTTWLADPNAIENYAAQQSIVSLVASGDIQGALGLARTQLGDANGLFTQGQIQSGDAATFINALLTLEDAIGENTAAIEAQTQQLERDLFEAEFRATSAGLIAGATTDEQRRAIVQARAYEAEQFAGFNAGVSGTDVNVTIVVVDENGNVIDTVTTGSDDGTITVDTNGNITTPSSSTGYYGGGSTPSWADKDPKRGVYA